MSAVLLSVAGAGCIDPVQNTTEVIEVYLTTPASDVTYRLLLPVIQEGGSPASVYEQVSAIGGNATVAVENTPKGTMISVTGTGNASFRGSVSTAPNERYRAYQWSPTPTEEGIEGNLTVDAFANPATGGNLAVEVSITFYAKSGRSWNGLARSAGFHGLLELNGQWQSLRGMDIEAACC